MPVARQRPPAVPSATQVLAPDAVMQLAPAAQMLAPPVGSQAPPTATVARQRRAVAVTTPLQVRPMSQASPASGSGRPRRRPRCRCPWWWRCRWARSAGPSAQGPGCRAGRRRRGIAGTTSVTVRAKAPSGWRPPRSRDDDVHGRARGDGGGGGERRRERARRVAAIVVAAEATCRPSARSAPGPARRRSGPSRRRPGGAAPGAVVAVHHAGARGRAVERRAGSPGPADGVGPRRVGRPRRRPPPRGTRRCPSWCCR